MRLVYSFRFRAVAIALGIAATLPSNMNAAPPNLPSNLPSVTRIATADPATIQRRENVVIVTPNDAAQLSKVTFPRLYGRVLSTHWNDSSHTPVELLSHPNQWSVQWSSVPNGGSSIEIKFEDPPLLAKETHPMAIHGDGSFLLHAFQANTFGEKLLYEPQPHKNTVGYWTESADYAVWQIRLDEPGRFNVGLLQGCGTDQGGTALITFRVENDVVDELEMSVKETGHFQNFQWRHLGHVDLNQTGVITLQITPKTIKNTALMDVRMISLTPLP